MKTRTETPFPLRYAEKVSLTVIDGEYNSELQYRVTEGKELLAAGTTTSSETDTGGSNDTDQDTDID